MKNYYDTNILNEPRRIKVIDLKGKILAGCFITRATSMVKKGKATMLNKNTMRLNFAVK